MSAKPATDWEAIELHYRAGILTLREIGKQFGISHAAISKKAEEKGWKRDLSAKVMAKARAELVTTDEVTSSVTTERAINKREMVDQAAAAIVKTIVGFELRK